MSTYAERKAAWEAHNLHRQQASIWAAERARVFHEEDVEALREDYLKNKARGYYRNKRSIIDISHMLCVPYEQVRDWVIDLIQDNRDRKYLSPRGNLSPEVERTKYLRDQGLTYREIGEIMKCHPDTAQERYIRHPDVVYSPRRLIKKGHYWSRS